MLITNLVTLYVKMNCKNSIVTIVIDCNVIVTLPIDTSRVGVENILK